MKFLFSLFMSVILAAFFVVPAFGEDETITITTYYPSPFGVYKTLKVLNGQQEILLGKDSNDPNIELRSNDGSGEPQITLSNDSSNDDSKIILKGDDDLWVQGGTTTFANDDETPAKIRVREVWYCSSY